MNLSPDTSRQPNRLPGSEFVAAVVVVAIAVAITLSGPLETIGQRAPVAMLGGGSFALGALLAWGVRRWKARR